MLGKRRIISLLVFSVSLVIGMFFVSAKSVKAYYNDDQAMAVAPSGIDLKNLGKDDALFVGGQYTGFKPIAKQDRNDPSIYPILQMSDTHTKDAVSSLWSNNENDNYLDVTQKQTLSFWIYFGDSYSNPQGTAFVLQNSGPNAIAAGDNNGMAGGQSMGVWGGDKPERKDLSDLASTAIQKSWALEFDTRGNGSPSIGDIDKAEQGNSYDTYQLIENTSVSNGWPHLAWNYPGRTTTYNIARTFETGLVITQKHNVYQMRHKNSEQIWFGGLNAPTDAWHHVQIEYTPPAQKGGMAKLKYSINLKRVDTGVQNPNSVHETGQTPYSNTIDLDTSEFQLGDSNKLRYGFTSAAGEDTPATEAIVFESIPALVQAEPSAYVVDETTNSRIGATTPAFDGDDVKLPTTKKVHPNDDLTFKYLLNYQGGKQSADGINATIDLPENVTFGSDGSDTIGTATYTSADGSTTKEVTLTTNNISDNKLTYDLLSLNNKSTTDWASVKIELNATANAIPDGAANLTVPISHLALEGPNYIADVQTDEFDIVEPSATLTISTDQGTINSQIDGGFIYLLGKMEFDPAKTIVNNDMDIYYTINGIKNKLGVDTESPAGQYRIPITTSESNGFKLGENKVVVQVVDTKYQAPDGSIETIASNKVEYTINVTDISLIVTPDKSTINVNDNGKQTMSGTIKLSEPLEITGFDNNSSSNGYRLTDGTGEVQDWQTFMSGNSSFDYEYTNEEHTEIHYTFTVGPIGSLMKGLTVGENNLKVGFRIQSLDGTATKPYAGSVDYTLNVPDIDITLNNSGQEDVAALSGQKLFLPAKINYKDNPTYGYDLSKMHRVITVDGSTQSLQIVNKEQWLTGEYELNEGIFWSIFTGIDKSKETFDAEYYVTDPYHRESNKVSFNGKRIKNYTQLSTADSYKFKECEPTPGVRELIGRDGDWGISVYSYNSPWVLTASAGNMVRTNTDGGGAAILDGNIVFIDPNDNDNIKNMNINADGDPAVIDAKENSTTATTDVDDEWSDADGILLDLNSVSAGGTYSGTINWNLTNSI